jgi:uncharacterized protein
MKVLLEYFKTAYSTQKRPGKQVGKRTICVMNADRFAGPDPFAALPARPRFRIVPVMRFHQDTSSGNAIQSYDAQGIVVNDRRITHSVVISARHIEAWAPGSFDDLDPADLAALADYQPGIVLLGTGTTLRFPPLQWLVGLQRRGIGVEVMSNDAAIRTYSVLLSEDRNVLLALLLGRKQTTR